MKRIFWLTLLPSSVYKYDNWSIFLWMQARFLFGAWSRICRENLLFDRKRSEIWLVITGHVKTKGDYESDSFEPAILVWAHSLVQEYESWQIRQFLSFLTTFGTAGLFLRSRILLHNFDSLFTCRRSSGRKIPASESLFNQSVACYFFNKRLQYRCLLVNFTKLSRKPFLRNTLKLLLLYLWNISII